MKTKLLSAKRLLLATLCAGLAAVATANAEEAFSWTVLVSDIHGVAPNTDENLVNPWGIAPGPHGTFWVANAGSGTLTVYDAQGRAVPRDNPLVVTVPPPDGSDPEEKGEPTGLVLNHHALLKDPGDDFVISANGHSGASLYLTATENGTIAGYQPEVDRTHAIIAVDHSGQGAIYKGLALARDGQGNHRLYATNFHAGTIEVFDHKFQPVTPPGGFTDPHPQDGFAPFNIKRYAASSKLRYLLVTYAKQDADAEDDVAGPGNGYINVFDPDGRFVKRLVPYITPDPASPEGNHLNAPWGMAISRSSFTRMDRSNHSTSSDRSTRSDHSTRPLPRPPFGRPGPVLLVGNFGDGTIQRFSLGDLSGTPHGPLEDRHGNPLQFDGLWGLQFGIRFDPPELMARDEDDLLEHGSGLYFAAGIADEEHGLFGRIFRR
jgi:uncharacterized protein (TIGR03118 family)